MHKLLIPALRQSTYERMACPESYQFIQIEGHSQAPSMPSDRGSDVHHVMSEYTRHCAESQVSADWKAFDELTSTSGFEAGQILDGIRLNHMVDYRHVLATEIRLALTETLQPAYRIKEDDGSITELPHISGVVYSEDLAAHAGTLDELLLFDEGQAKVADYKTHPRPFVPQTYQGCLYPLMVMLHFPFIRVIVFELNFVRYRNSYRSIEWSRDRIPEMALTVQRARSRQLAMHEGKLKMEALPGGHCRYCPKASDLSCSLGKLNPELALTLEERSRQQVWMELAIEINRAILRGAADAGAVPQFEDGKGMKHKMERTVSEHQSFPLDHTTIAVLDEWARTHRADDPYLWGLEISSTKLKQRLETKMRAPLREAFENSVIQMTQKPVLKFVAEDPEDQQPELFDSDF